MLQNGGLPFEASSANVSKTAISEALYRGLTDCSRHVYRTTPCPHFVAGTVTRKKFSFNSESLGLERSWRLEPVPHFTRTNVSCGAGRCGAKPADLLVVSINRSKVIGRFLSRRESPMGSPPKSNMLADRTRYREEKCNGTVKLRSQDGEKQTVEPLARQSRTTPKRPGGCVSVKDWLSGQAKSMVRSKQGAAARKWLGLEPTIAANHELDRVTVDGAVVVYFSDVVQKSYQLEQWLPTLEELNKHHRVVLVFRKVQALRHFRKLTTLPKIFLRRLEDLVTFYNHNNFQLCLYVNNGVANFQSLSAPNLVHVHINHGESDKLSMVSNQAKAYDRVFVAGQAAIERHRKALHDFDLSKLIPVGRPQLETDYDPVLEPFSGRTLMYAPTWEGENEQNNYTSVDLYGVKIIETLLSQGNTRVIYKPHPRIATSTNKAVSEAHQEIVRILDESSQQGIPHQVVETGNILAYFQGTDGMITDISSVGLDYLYLCPEKPLVLTDRRNNPEALNLEAPISKACPVISQGLVEETLSSLDNLYSPQAVEMRSEMRSFYFGTNDSTSSTQAFLAAIERLLKARAESVSERNQ